jgi:transcriptional regulator with XRE-family HTH domain
MITFGQRIKQLRTDNKLTQEELADQIQVKRSTLAKWETKGSIPNINIIKKIANSFGITTDFLLGNDDDSIK